MRRKDAEALLMAKEITSHEGQEDRESRLVLLKELLVLGGTRLLENKKHLSLKQV